MRRDRVALERRRLQAARLLEQGLTEAEAARRLGVQFFDTAVICSRLAR